MFGYVLPAKDKLSEEEKKRFERLYCGLCHTMGRRYGFFSRFLLNYDFAFLAMLLSSSEEPACASCRCPSHPIRGCSYAEETAALDAAAARSIVLAWWQLCDHVDDSGFFASLKYRSARLLLRRSYAKARACAAEFDGHVQRQLKALAALEESNCASLDAAAEPFAALMAAIAQDAAQTRQSRILSQIFYHLGRWIYLVDAADDLARDNKSGNYNPLRYRYGITEGGLTQEAKQALAQTLDESVRRMASAYALSDFGAWTGILDSVFYAGLYRVGNSVLNGCFRRRNGIFKLRKSKKEQL